MSKTLKPLCSSSVENVNGGRRQEKPLSEPIHPNAPIQRCNDIPFTVPRWARYARVNGTSRYASENPTGATPTLLHLLVPSLFIWRGRRQVRWDARVRIFVGLESTSESFLLVWQHAQIPPSTTMHHRACTLEEIHVQ